MVRDVIPPPGTPVTLQVLEQAVLRHQAEIAEFLNDPEEFHLGYADAGRLAEWQGQLQARILAARNALGPADSFTQVQIRARQGSADLAYSVLISLANIRTALNSSLENFSAVKGGRQDEERSIADKLVAKEKEQRQKKQDIVAARKPGLGKKWGLYNEKLKHKKGHNMFRQYVPAGADTVQHALRSRNILDAVYHQDKAFWISTQDFKIASSAGKDEMRYYFSEEGARSLMEDYLICASGDFDDDNEQKFTGETSCPFFTLWKSNEVGAYGIGSERLKELAHYVEKIEAFDSAGKPIALKAEKDKK